MATSKMIDEFLQQEKIAVAGVSRNKKKFGYYCFKYLKEKNFNAVPVNPNASLIDDDICFPSISSIPGGAKSVLIVAPPKEGLGIAADAFLSGVKHIWFQLGAESDEAIKYCSDKGMNVIYNECILMFAKPESFHKVHRWVNKIFGKLPA